MKVKRFLLNIKQQEAALIPTPIRQVLFTIQNNGIQVLLMGGQACVFYGAAQVNKDIDLLLLAGEKTLQICE